MEHPWVSPRRDGKRWLRLAVIFVMCVLLADALVGDRGLAQTRRSNREYKQAVRALHDLRRENAVLREQQRRLREDGRTIEALARQELGLIRPGEILFIVNSGR